MAIAITARASAQVGSARHPGKVGITALTRQTRIANGASALLHTVGTAMAGGVGDRGVHENVTQPHTGHLGVVHCLQQYSLQARQDLQHLGPLHGPARLVHPVFL